MPALAACRYHPIFWQKRWRTRIDSHQPQWDTFALFERLLDDFDQFLKRTQQHRPADHPNTDLLHAASTGFLRFRPPIDWGPGYHEFIIRRLEGGLSLYALEWYEECAPAIQMFACLALGALLGKYAAEEIDDAGFLLGDAHLAAFLVEQSEAICTRYRYRCHP